MGKDQRRKKHGLDKKKNRRDKEREQVALRELTRIKTQPDERRI